MKFKIVEGDSFWEKKQKFVQLYNEELLAKDIQEKLDLTGTQYNKLVRECSSEGLIVPRRKHMLKK